MELTESQTGDAVEGGGVPAGPNQERTIALFLKASGRRNHTVPIRRSFLQVPGPGARGQAPMQVLVSRKQERPLDAYLLFAAVSTGEDFSVTEWSTSWARSLGIFEEKTGGAAVSRAWRVLRELRIVETSRGEGRRTRVTKLKEDGTGARYTPPGATGSGVSPERYFQLPFAYWEDGLNTKLSLPGKAMLLIALSLRAFEFSLVHAQICDGYGINKQTVAKGINDLIEHKVIDVSGQQWYETLRTRSGVSQRPLYQFADRFVQPGISRITQPKNSKH
ncbi:hypothetical protein ACWF2L_40380 [Streptomyces anulatus]